MHTKTVKTLKKRVTRRSPQVSAELQTKTINTLTTQHFYARPVNDS